MYVRAYIIYTLIINSFIRIFSAVVQWLLDLITTFIFKEFYTINTISMNKTTPGISSFILYITLSFVMFYLQCSV